MRKGSHFSGPMGVKALVISFCLLLVASVISEFFIHKHIFFSWERYPLFYASYGFTAFVLLIAVAKYILRPFVKRDDKYYDD